MANLVKLRARRAGSHLRGAPQRVKRALESRTAQVNPNPIIILGNHKAGTSAITALLAAATDRSVALELRRELTGAFYPELVRGSDAFERLIQRNRLDFSRDIVKENHLTPFYDLVRDRFPDSHIIWVVRDPRDNIRSILNRLKLPGDTPRLSNNQWRSVPKVWQQALNNDWLELHAEGHVAQLAERWALTSRLAIEHSHEVNVVSYEAFNADKMAEIHKIAARAGLPVTADISPLLDVQYQPRGDHKVTWDEFFGSENLTRLEAICRVEMQTLGYTQPSSGSGSP